MVYAVQNVRSVQFETGTPKLQIICRDYPILTSFTTKSGIVSQGFNYVVEIYRLMVYSGARRF